MAWPVVAKDYLALAQRLCRREVGAGMTGDDAGAGLRPPAADDRPPRHLRACLPERAAARARLLHRRHGAGARRRHPRTRSRPGRSTAWPALPCGSSTTPSRYSGACRNRMDASGQWLDEPSLDDCWGRCLWGLGTAAAHSDIVWVRQIGARPVRTGRAGALAVAARDGVRGPRRRRNTCRRIPTIAPPADCSPTTRSRVPSRTVILTGRGPSRD